MVTAEQDEVRQCRSDRPGMIELARARTAQCSRINRHRDVRAFLGQGGPFGQVQPLPADLAERAAEPAADRPSP
jgi:hypothetical protein